ncbi:hypothetical protein MNBD_GAMMA12-2660 [hydrothermal vent metagenome]|uniref:Cytochrome c domain-containing protein n=1 Tax=hydrothermal vent metagenome TaxID=652676 RepID=A0A3B0YIM8_9ZZZZ
MKLINYSLLLLVLVMSTSVIGKTSATAGDRTRGAKLWSDVCGHCHNIRAADELRDDQWVTTAFHMRIRAGLTGQETRDVLAFLTSSNNSSTSNIFQSSSNNTRVASNTKVSGKAIYFNTCVACHGAKGKGTVPGAPDFTSTNGPLAKNDKELVKNITDGFQSPGSLMAMPAKGGNPALTREDIKAVLSFLRKTYKR